MLVTITTLITLLSYLAAALLYLSSRSRFLCYLLSLLALSAHSFLLYLLIDGNHLGQNLTLFNIVSLVAWLVALLAFLSSVRLTTLISLPIAAFVLAMLSIALTFFFPSIYIIPTAAIPQTFIHIVLSIITLSVLCLSGLLGLFVILQEKLLRFKSHSSAVWHYLPSLQTMEKLLFGSLRLGFMLLSLVLVTSLYSFFDQLAISWVMSKAVLVLFAWLIFAVLLTGHRWFGWRGYKVGYGALAAVTLLTFAYLGCQFIMEGSL